MKYPLDYQKWLKLRKTKVAMKIIMSDYKKFNTPQLKLNL